MYDHSSVVSKALYLLLLVTSVSSVCIDLAKILKWGEKPIIGTYLSFTFLKIFFFILTKFLMQSYALSMAIKSIMFNVAILVDDDEYSELSKDLFQRYYRGIDKDPQLLTFDQATLYFPLIMLALLFLPSIICAFVFSVWNSGLQSWSDNFVQKAVLLLFAVMTNMSYFSTESIPVSTLDELSHQENPKHQVQVERSAFYRNCSHLEVNPSTPPLRNNPLTKNNVGNSGNFNQKYF